MSEQPAIRILLAKIGLDTHDRGVLALISAFRDAGFEVIYTGRYATPDGVAKTAIQEDVDVIALSDHTGSMPIVAESVLQALREQDAEYISVISGGLILASDRPTLEAMGVTGNFGPGTPMETIIEHVRQIAR